MSCMFTEFAQMNCVGIIIGFVTFFCIGMFHPLVIKAEYYFGRKSWRAFLLAGLFFLIASFVVRNDYVSIVFGVISFSSFWGIVEVFQQHNRVKKGWFPMNPKHTGRYK